MCLLTALSCNGAGPSSTATVAVAPSSTAPVAVGPSSTALVAAGASSTALVAAGASSTALAARSYMDNLEELLGDIMVDGGHLDFGNDDSLKDDPLDVVDAELDQLANDLQVVSTDPIDNGGEYIRLDGYRKELIEKVASSYEEDRARRLDMAPLNGSIGHYSRQLPKPKQNRKPKEKNRRR